MLMLTVHMDLLRVSQSACLSFASFVYEAFLVTPLHPELLNFKLLRRPGSLAQELCGLEGESAAVTQRSLRKPSLLTKAAGGDLPVPRLRSAAGWRLLLLLPPTRIAGSVRHLPASGGYFCLPAGSGLPSPGCGALRHSSTTFPSSYFLPQKGKF